VVAVVVAGVNEEARWVLLRPLRAAELSSLLVILVQLAVGELPRLQLVSMQQQMGVQLGAAGAVRCSFKFEV
jgi:hypothetical protein